MFRKRISQPCGGSPVEEAQARDRGRLRRDRPRDPISEAAKKYLARENAQHFLKKAPEGLSEKDIGKYDLIIAMKPKHKDVVLSKCPECQNRIVVWNIDDPYFLPQGYAEKIFKQIEDKVAELANSL